MDRTKLFFIVQKLTKPETTEPTANTELSEQDHETSNETESNSCKDDHEDVNEDEDNEEENDEDEDEEEVEDDDDTKITEEAHNHEVYIKHNLTIENVALPVMTSQIDNEFDAQVQVESIEKKRTNTDEDKKPELNLKLDIPDVPFEEFVIPETPKRYMDDGVEIRELRPGFQELGNCKRFWKAQQLIGTRKTMFLELSLFCSLTLVMVYSHQISTSSLFSELLTTLQNEFRTIRILHVVFIFLNFTEHRLHQNLK